MTFWDFLDENLGMILYFTLVIGVLVVVPIIALIYAM